MLWEVTKQIEGHTICALGDAAAWPVQVRNDVCIAGLCATAQCYTGYPFCLCDSCDGIAHRACLHWVYLKMQCSSSLLLLCRGLFATSGTRWRTG